MASEERITGDQQKLMQQLQSQALQDARANGERMLELFQALPAAVLASERAEYDRIVKRYGKDDPRAAMLEQSLDRQERVDAEIARGRARVVRLMQAADIPGTAFHGFVSDEGGEPLPGLTVHVASSALPKELSARTAQDGYFRVGLPEASAAGAAREAAAPGGAQVWIADSEGRRVHEDPVPLDLRGGSAYREYSVQRPEPGPVRASERPSPRRTS